MKYLKIFLTIFFVVGLAGPTLAAPVLNEPGDGYEDVNGDAFSYYANSGVYQGFIDQQPTPNNLINYLSGLYPEYDFIFLGKVEEDDGLLVPEGESQFAGTIYDDGQSGTWFTTGDPAALVSFYTVKAGGGPGFALYSQDPATTSGSWSTYDLFVGGHPGGTLEISNIMGVAKGTPVPEPTSILLLGIGLVGLASLRKIRK